MEQNPLIQWVPHSEAQLGWPESGRVILASYDDEHVVVYQAYNDAIADYAVSNQEFGGPFKFERMSWIKPNFLWMMYRSGWASKPNQERILAVTLRRAFFEEILSAAVPSTWWRERFHDRDTWQRAVKGSDVRLQWDPDHAPGGSALSRRAIQLGLRGPFLQRFATEEAHRIDDVTEFAKKGLGKSGSELFVPKELPLSISAECEHTVGMPPLPEAAKLLDSIGHCPSTQTELDRVRRILARETVAERRGEVRKEDLAFACCLLLYNAGHVEDSLRVWRAKSAGMDLGSMIDIELMLGAGLPATLEYLASQHGDQEAEAAGDELKRRAVEGSLEEPDEVADRAMQYFGLEKGASAG